VTVRSGWISGDRGGTGRAGAAACAAGAAGVCAETECTPAHTSDAAAANTNAVRPGGVMFIDMSPEFDGAGRAGDAATLHPVRDDGNSAPGQQPPPFTSIGYRTLVDPISAIK
jgi:hypothetical protein